MTAEWILVGVLCLLSMIAAYKLGLQINNGPGFGWATLRAAENTEEVVSVAGLGKPSAELLQAA